MEVYESHLGGIYFSKSLIDDEYLYCEECGDSDRHLGHASTWQDVLDMITNDDGWCPFCKGGITQMKGEFNAWIEKT